MERAELETIININQADRYDGYFEFGTSYEPHWNRLCAKIKDLSKLISLKESKSPDGKITWRQCRVPLAYLSPSLALRKPPPPRKPGKNTGFGYGKGKRHDPVHTP